MQPSLIDSVAEEIRLGQHGSIPDLVLHSPSDLSVVWQALSRLIIVSSAAAHSFQGH